MLKIFVNYCISGRQKPLPIKQLRVECDEEDNNRWKLQNVLVCFTLGKKWNTWDFLFYRPVWVCSALRERESPKVKPVNTTVTLFTLLWLD